MKISIEYNNLIQITSNLLDIISIIGRYDDYTTNESIMSREEWFTKLWGGIIGIKDFGFWIE